MYKGKHLVTRLNNFYKGKLHFLSSLSSPHPSDANAKHELINNSTDKLSEQTLLSFKRALADDGYVKEELCLSTVMFLSKFALGRGACRIAYWVRDSMKEIIGKS